MRMLAHQIPARYSLRDAAAIIVDARQNVASTTEIESELSNLVEQRNLIFERITEFSSADFLESIDTLREELIKPSASGVYIVKLATGERKTTGLLIPLAEHGVKTGEFPAFITARRSIVYSTHIKGATRYNENVTGQLMEPGLVICINSIIRKKWRPTLEQCDVVLLEEANQLLMHLIDGSIEKSERPYVYRQLVELINQARLIVLADADATPMLLDFLYLTNKSGHIKVLEAPADHSNVAVIIESIALVMHKIYEAVKFGLRVLVASDTKSNAESLAFKIQTDFPEKSILLITAATISRDAAKEFTANPNACCHDIVIFSPAITGSVSITARVFDLNAALFGSQEILPSEAIQMMRRDRTATQFLVGLDHRKSHPPTDAIEDLCMRGIYGRSYPTNFDVLCSRVIENCNFLRSNFAAAFIWLLERKKFQVTINRQSDSRLLTEGRRIKSTGKKTLNNIRRQSLLTARPSNTGVVAGLDMVTRVTGFDVEAERSRIRHAFGKEEITQADVDLWEGGRLLEYLQNLRIVLMSQVAADRHNKIETSLHVTLADRSYIVLRRELYSLLLSTAGIDLNVGACVVTEEQARAGLEALSSRKKDWDRISDIKWSSTWLFGKRPFGPFLNILRQTFGIKLILMQKRNPERGGAREGVYKIDFEWYSRITELLEL